MIDKELEDLFKMFNCDCYSSEIVGVIIGIIARYIQLNKEEIGALQELHNQPVLKITEEENRFNGYLEGLYKSDLLEIQFKSDKDHSTFIEMYYVVSKLGREVLKKYNVILVDN